MKSKYHNLNRKEGSQISQYAVTSSSATSEAAPPNTVIIWQQIVFLSLAYCQGVFLDYPFNYLYQLSTSKARI